MVVFGRLKGDEVGSIIYTGDMASCKKFCKSIIPAEYDSLSIDLDNGVISKRIISSGAPAEDFKELIEVY